MTYLLYVFLLLLLAYLGPALAIYPRLILDSRTALAIPIVSIAVIGLVYVVLSKLDIYARPVVVVVTVGLLIVSIIRVWQLLRSRPVFCWPRVHVYSLMVCLGIGLYTGIRLGTGGFDSNDEIYSWNLWAIQHYLGEPIDLFYVRSPYPQMFPIFISYCYKILGNIELQLPIRSLLGFFPLITLGAITLVPNKPDTRNSLYSLLLAIIVFVLTGKYFSMGLADPLMTTSLVLAVFFFIQFSREPGKLDFLVLSVICAAVGLFTKQPALIWAVFSFPFLALLRTARKELPWQALFGAFVLVLLAILWITGQGQGFQHNQGVLHASMLDRDLVDQIIYSAQKNLLNKPLALLLITATMIVVYFRPHYRDVMLVFIVPSLFAWLIFGAYDFRLGMHVIAVSALLLAEPGYRLFFGSRSLYQAGEFISKHTLSIGTILFLIILIASLAIIYKINNKYQGSFSPYLAGHNTIYKYFGKDANIILSNIYDNKQILLWVPSNYIYGIFYAHTPMMRPNHRGVQKYGARNLLQEIDKNRPDYLFDSGDRVSYGPASDILRKLATEQCPELFLKIASPPNKYGYTVYRLRNNDSLIAQCKDQLQHLKGAK